LVGGRRHVGNTGQVRAEDARAFERQLRVDLARRGGQLPVKPGETPTFQQWSEVYFEQVSRRIKRPDILERTLRASSGGTSFDEDRKFITIADHKTDRSTGFEMVVPISPQLREILDAAQSASNGAYVIQYGGRPVGSLKTALRNARRAHVPYGLRARGATFHTLRHLAATMLAELRVPEALRKETMGHKEIRTTQIYTHLRPVHQVEPLEQLSNATPLADLLRSCPPGAAGADGRKTRPSG